MTDQTITAGQQGAYEFPLEADEPTQVTIEDVGQYGTVQVISHTGTAPVYAATQPVTVRDGDALMIAPGGYIDFGVGGYDRGNVTIHLISSSDATVSVVRS